MNVETDTDWMSKKSRRVKTKQDTMEGGGEEVVKVETGSLRVCSATCSRLNMRMLKRKMVVDLDRLKEFDESVRDP